MEGPADVTRLITRIDTIPEITSIYNDIKSWADGETTSSIVSGNNVDDLPQPLIQTALLTLVEKEKGNNYSHYLNLSKALINNLLANYGGYKSYDIQSIAITYDWLFDDLTLSEKQSYVQGMINAGTRLAKQGYMQRYPVANESNYQIGVLYAGIAFYNDGINDQMANDIINYYGEFLEKVSHPLSQILAGNSGGVNTTKNYFYFGLASRHNFIEMWRTSTGRDLWSSSSYDKNVPYWDIYTIRPDNIALKHGHRLVNIGWPSSRNVNYPLLAKVYNDPLASYFSADDLYHSAKNVLWRKVLWYDPSIPSQSYESLPLTRLFDGTGYVIMRTGWNLGTQTSPSDDVFAQFSSGNFFYFKDDHHQNDFTIYYKGSIAGDNPGVNSKHAIHNNTIIIDDEDQITSNANYTNTPTPSEILAQWGDNSPNDIGDLLRLESTSSYDYMLGDATNAYNPNKLSHFTREFVFLRPNYFVVFDRVNTTSSTYSKKYLLHSINVPKVDNINPPDGTTTYNTDMIQIDRGGTSANGYPGLNGRLFSKTLLPTNSQITVVGSGQSFDYDRNEVAHWRLEIEPTTPQLNDNFLHVMQVGDSDTLPSMTPTTLINADTMTGTLINDTDNPQIVMFSSDSQGADVTTVTYNANYPSSKTATHLLLDIQPGTYDIYKNSIKIHSDIGASTQGVLTFTSTGGSTFQITQTGTTPPPPTLQGDLNNDDTVNSLDWSIMNSAWNTNDATADINGDGIVNTIDWSVMNSNWSN